MWRFLTSLNPVRATADERARRLPGDELIEQPLAALNHAITIHRPPHDVWPWLAQMGAGTRAGWYSYDAIDNARQPSAARVVPELQSLSAGMVFPALPGAKEGFTLLAFEPERFLLLGWFSNGGLLMTWSFVLKEETPGATRLLVRARGGQHYQFYHLPWWIARHIVPLIHFVMERRQLLGIRQRVEASA